MATALLKLTDVQLGTSVTATNNFTMYQPASPDGTVRWGVGNSGSVTDIVTLNSSGYVGIGTSSPSRKLTISGGGQAFSDAGGADRTIAWGDSSTGIYPVSISGFGTTGALAFNTAAFGSSGTERMRLDSSGNLGLGVTPSAWGTSASTKALQVGNVSLFTQSSGGNYLQLANNAYQDSSLTWKYIGSDYASNYQQFNGIHKWYTAPSGTAGNAITFTQAMTLDASGNLGIGTSSPQSNLEVVSGTNGVNNGVRIRSTASGATGNWNINISGSNSLGFYDVIASSSPRAVIDSSGNVGIGTSSPAAKLDVSGTIQTLQTVQSSSGADLILNANGANRDVFLRVNGTTVATAQGSTNNFQFNSGYGSVATAYGCRAWVNFQGTGTVTIRASGNVSSIGDGGVGNYVINFSTAMPNTNYAVNLTCSGESRANSARCTTIATTGSTTTVTMDIYNPAAGAFQDADVVQAAVFR